MPGKDVYKFPGTIVCDTREKNPLSFDGITLGKKEIPCEIDVISGKLSAGDYSLLGHEDAISIERKSPADCVGTIIHGRDRFKRELERLSLMRYSAILVEADWSHLLRYCESFTGSNPVSVDSSILSFMLKFPNVHWIFRPDRYTAAKTVVKLFDLYLRRKDRENE